VTDEEATTVATAVAAANADSYIDAAVMAGELAERLPERDWVAYVAHAGGWDADVLREVIAG
jgi:hypothetical protein